MKKILRIIVSSEHELPFLTLNGLESHNKVDEIILCEANFTHSGEKRTLIFGDLIRKLPPEIETRIRYLPINLDRFIRKDVQDTDDLHFNEQLIRNSFTNYCNLTRNDVVIALDADEIIYSSQYNYIFKKLMRSVKSRCIRLKLRQFFYRLNYYWTDCNFNSPVASRASVFLGNNNAQWRDYGPVTEKYVGVHFSWVMGVDQMIRKLKTYAHTDLYGDFAEEEILKRAIEEKKYIFDESLAFTIRTLDYDSPLLPDSIDQVFTREHPWFDWRESD